MKFNYKSKTGFTLIELLVVIGILAVLVAIAIPSVAGLINRANISADNTNATEMTNAVERFTSEYELYKQDLSTGTLDTTNLDASSSRVYNVTGITSRADIEKFESNKGIEGKGVNIDTKYPFNELTIKAVVKNYMKTTSSTFSPKQSDMAFYYSPTAGKVVVAKEGSTYIKLDTIAKTDDIMNNTTQLSTGNVGETLWMNITLNENSDKLISSIYATDVEKIYAPAPVTLKTDLDPVLSEDYDGEAPKNGDIYETEDYKYIYNVRFLNDYDSKKGYDFKMNGWCVELKNTPEKLAQTSYEPILSMIKGKPVVDMQKTFTNCTLLTTAPAIPNTVTNIGGAFLNCKALTVAPTIPSCVTNMKNAFSSCDSLTTPSEIPNSVINMNNTFQYCKSLTTAPTIPSSVINMEYTFNGCEALVAAPTIQEGVKNMSYAFSGCKNLESAPAIPSTVTSLLYTFSDCTSLVNPPDLTKATGVTTMDYAFKNCANIIASPVIPKNVTSMRETFYFCKKMETASSIPNGVTNMTRTFDTCMALKTAPAIPESVKDFDFTFFSCQSLRGDLIVDTNTTSCSYCLKLVGNTSSTSIVIKGAASIETKKRLKETGGLNITIE